MVPSSERPTRIVAFLLDVSGTHAVQQHTQSAGAVDLERYAQKFVTAVQRLLNYHSACPDCDLQWSYQFFDSDSCYLSLGSRSIPLLPASRTAIQTFRDDTTRRVPQASSGNAKSFKDKYAAITRALEEALRDVDWDPRSDTFSVDSLLGDDDDQMDTQPSSCKSGHSVKPLLYLFSAAPDSIQALRACERANSFLPSAENEDVTHGRQSMVVHATVSDLHSSAIEKPVKLVEDEFTKTVGALAKRDIRLVWVDSKPTLAGMKSAERSHVIPAFGRWLSLYASDTSFIDISSLLLDDRVLSPTALIARIHTDDQKNTGNSDAQKTTDKTHGFQWCLADVLTTKPATNPTMPPVTPSKRDPRSSSGPSPKTDSDSPKREPSTPSFLRYFRAKLSSRFPRVCDEMKRTDLSDAPSDHFVVILRGLMPDNLKDEDLFNMNAFESSAQILRPAGHSDTQSDGDDVELWTALFAGLMDNLVKTRRSILADVCVRIPGDSECVQTLHPVLIRPITALSASVRDVSLNVEVSRMRIVNSIADISILGDRPGSLLIPNLPSPRVAEAMPEDHFDYYLAGHQRHSTSARRNENEDLEKTSSIRHCLQGLASEAGKTNSPPHLIAALHKTSLDSPKRVTSHDSVKSIGKCPQNSTAVESKRLRNEDNDRGLDGCPPNKLSDKQMQASEARKIARMGRDLQSEQKSGSTSVLEKGFGPDNYHQAASPVHTSSEDTGHSYEALATTRTPTPSKHETREAKSQTTRTVGVPVRHAPPGELVLTGLALTTLQAQPCPPSSLSPSPNLNNELISPVTVRPESKPSDTKQIHSEGGMAKEKQALTQAIERFTSNVAKLAAPDNDAGMHVKTSLGDLEMIVRFMSDEDRFAKIKKEVINENLREDSDIILDLEAAQKDCRGVEKSSASNVICSGVWQPVLVAFGQVLWQLAEYAHKRRQRPRPNLPQNYLRLSAERSISVLSGIQMIGEATASSPPAHALFHEAFSCFFDTVLIQFLKGSGARRFEKVMKRIFARFDRDSHKTSPCVSAESRERELHSSIACGAEARHDTGPCNRQSSYTQLVRGDSENERERKQSHKDGVRSPSSRTSEPPSSIRTPHQDSDRRILKKNVQRTLLFEGEHSPEKRPAGSSNDVGRMTKRQKKQSSKDHNQVIADARLRKPVAIPYRRSQLSTKTVELRTTKHRRTPERGAQKAADNCPQSINGGHNLGKKKKLSTNAFELGEDGKSRTPEHAAKKGINHRPQNKDAEPEIRNDKLLVVSARPALRRSPRNKNTRPPADINVRTDSVEQTTVPKRRTSPRNAREVNSGSSASRSRQTKIASHDIVPATPIRKKRSRKEPVPDWTVLHNGRLTRGTVKKLADVHEQGGIPQSPQ